MALRLERLTGAGTGGVRGSQLKLGGFRCTVGSVAQEWRAPGLSVRVEDG